MSEVVKLYEAIQETVELGIRFYANSLAYETGGKTPISFFQAYNVMEDLLKAEKELEECKKNLNPALALIGGRV